MARQIHHATRAHRDHQAGQHRQAAFHQPTKKLRVHQVPVGPDAGYPTAPVDTHKFGPGQHGGDSSKHETNI